MAKEAGAAFDVKDLLNRRALMFLMQAWIAEQIRRIEDELPRDARTPRPRSAGATPTCTPTAHLGEHPRDAHTRGDGPAAVPDGRESAPPTPAAAAAAAAAADGSENSAAAAGPAAAASAAAPAAAAAAADGSENSAAAAGPATDPDRWPASAVGFR